jgi:type IV secretory pathway VirB9-like protein
MRRAEPAPAKAGVLCFLALLALASPAHALEEPRQMKSDPHMYTAIYRPDDPVHVWSAPGAVVRITFAEDERVALTPGSDTYNVEAQPAGNVLLLKFHTCIIPQPLDVTTQKADGRTRSYIFEIETHPQICPRPPADDKASANQLPDIHLYAKLGTDDLGPGSNIMYGLKILYPHDAWLRRQAARRAAEEREREEAAQQLLAQGQAGNSPAACAGCNIAYRARGSAVIMPPNIWDDGVETRFSFPGMQHIPAIFRGQCGRDTEASTNLHATGDVVTIPGTELFWCLRDGKNVVEVENLRYTPFSPRPDTHTNSPYVVRYIKGQTLGR